MKVEHLRLLPALLLYAFLVVFVATPVRADNRSYFKAYGSDVMSGGWFANGASCDTSSSSNYQDPYYSNSSLGISADNRNGGILTYAKPNTDGSGNQHNGGGASSQYSAFALGAVEGNTSSSYGFYSNGANSSSNPYANSLTFANTSASGNTWGGMFEGSVRQSNCIADYYSKKPATAVSKTTADSLNSYISTNGSYSVTAASGSNYNLLSGPLSIPDSTKVTVFVNGSVYIGSNISYSGGNNVNTLPKFALVVKGSIYIDKSVTRLDGFYIAQPSSITSPNSVNTDTGVIWTCHPNDQASLPYTYPPTCNNPLVINGALVAKQVNFLRTKGDVSSSSIAEDTLSGGLASTNIAEIINYTPQMVMGGGFFTSSSNTASGLPIDSIFSLPPVF